MTLPRRRRQNRRREQRFVAVPKRRINWLQFVLAFIVMDILALGGWGLLRLTDPTFLPIREVEVSGEFRHLRPENVRQRVAEHLSRGFFALDVVAVRAAVLQEPWVDDVAVRRLWPDKLQLSVVERHAVARWGGNALLTADGVLFRPPRDEYPEGLVLLDGPSGSENQVLQNLDSLRHELAGTNQFVQSLTLNERRSWTFVLRDGPVVNVGRSDFDVRVRRFAEHYNVLAANASSRIERIDLRYTNGFSVYVDPALADQGG